MVATPPLSAHAPTRPARATWFAFALLLLINLAVTVFIGLGVWAVRDYPFDTDEASHTLPALRMSNELLAGDGRGFVGEVLAQTFYPPAGAVPLIPLFVLNGPSVTGARLAATATFFLAVLVLFGLAITIDPQTGWLAGLIAGLLTLTVRPLLLYAGLSMLEAPGLLVSLLFLWAYAVAVRSGQPLWFGLTSVLMAAVFLTKYSYGVVAVGAALLAELPIMITVLRRGEAGLALRRRWLPLFGPLALVLLLWFLRPGQLANFLGYSRPLSTAEPWLSLRNAVYYPRSFALHGLPSVWFAPVTVAGLIWGLTRWRDGAVRAVWLFFVLGMASVMVLNHPPNPRFIAPFIPAAHLLVGLMIAGLWRRFRSDTGLRRSWAAAGLGVAALLVLASVPTVIPRYRYAHSVLQARLETSPALAQTAVWLAETVGPGARVTMVNFFDQFSPPIVEWALAAQAGANPAVVDGVVLAEATPATTTALREAVLAGDATHLVLVEGGPWGAPFWPDYTAAFGDTLRETDRRSFRLVNYRVADWLDENQLGQAWEMVKAYSRQALELTVIVYAVERGK